VIIFLLHGLDVVKFQALRILVSFEKNCKNILKF
jgi:hypothetical protein